MNRLEAVILMLQLRWAKETDQETDDLGYLTSAEYERIQDGQQEGTLNHLEIRQ